MAPFRRNDAMSEEKSTIRCPHCGASIERTCPPEGKTLPGSPLRKCPDCGRLYFDEIYAEAALTAFEKAEIRFPYIKILYALIPTAGALVYLHQYRNAPGTTALVPLITFGAIAVLFDILLIAELVKAARRSKVKKELLARIEGRAGALEQELRESLERLKSKDYLDALTKCGEAVPAYFYQRIGEKPPKTHQKKR